MHLQRPGAREKTLLSKKKSGKNSEAGTIASGGLRARGGVAL